MTVLLSIFALMNGMPVAVDIRRTLRRVDLVACTSPLVDRDVNIMLSEPVTRTEAAMAIARVCIRLLRRLTR